MKNCPNCGAPIDPYQVKCEYCGTMYFDLATWLRDGEPCFINYSFDSFYGSGAITAQAIPHLETIEADNGLTDVITANGTKMFCINEKRCEINIRFDCIENKSDKTLFQIKMADAGPSPK